MEMSISINVRMFRQTIENQSKFFNPRIKFLGMFSKYFESEWSVSKVKIDEEDKIVGFDA